MGLNNDSHNRRHAREPTNREDEEQSDLLPGRHLDLPEYDDRHREQGIVEDRADNAHAYHYFHFIGALPRRFGHLPKVNKAVLSLYWRCHGYGGHRAGYQEGNKKEDEGPVYLYPSFRRQSRQTSVEEHNRDLRECGGVEVFEGAYGSELERPIN